MEFAISSRYQEQVSRPIGVQLVVFLCPSIPVVLFDIPEMSKCLNTLYLLSPPIFIIKGFICDLFVARNNSMHELKKKSKRTEQICGFYHSGS